MFSPDCDVARHCCAGRWLQSEPSFINHLDNFPRVGAGPLFTACLVLFAYSLGCDGLVWP